MHPLGSTRCERLFDAFSSREPVPTRLRQGFAEPLAHSAPEALAKAASLENALMAFHRRRAVGVKGLDRLQPPRLPLLALLLGPDDRLPVRRQDQPRPGIGDLDPVAAGLINIEEKSLLDGVLVRTSLDVDPVLQEDIRGTQDVFAAVERVGEMMEAAGRAGMIP